jgi:predicted acylesterase/phospholipase RssA
MVAETTTEETDSAQTQRLRALAFAGGGFDTIMQMGVVHALLVSRGKAPDHVVGISAGAVNAAALAEVLQEGAGLAPDERLVARARRLRAILDTYLELPRSFGNAALPDAFEVNAKRPLKPLELPIHLPDERKSRAAASRSKAGLIRLFNDILSIDLTVGAATRVIRRILAFRQAEELPRPAPARDTIVFNSVFLWLLLGRHFVAVSEIFSALFVAAWSGEHRSIPHWGRSLLSRAFKVIRLKAFAKMLANRLSSEATTAGEAMQRPLSSYLSGALRVGLGGLVFAALWLVPLVLLLPPQTIVKSPLIPKVRHFEISGKMVREEAKFALETVADTIPKLSSSTIPEKVADLAVAFWRVIAIVGLWLWNAVGFRWVTIVGLVIPFVIAVQVERRYGIKRAAAFLGVWIVAISAFDWPRLIWIGALAVVFLAVGRGTGSIHRRIVKHYEISDALLSADILQSAIVHCFDQRYYGHAHISAIIEAALARAPGVGSPGDDVKIKLGKYLTGEPGIHVAPVAANIKNGDLEILGSHVPVVDALLAATAIIPFFPAKDLRSKTGDKAWYIDGLNVSNEPMQPLFRHLREAHAAQRAKYDQYKTVDIYPVSDVPVDEVLRQDGEYSTLVDVGLRALELKGFRDAAMERRLTRLYTRSLPSGKAFVEVPLTDPDDADEKRFFIHAGLFPIELEKPARVNQRLYQGAGPDDFKRILRETVADGCRASLEAMLPQTLNTADRHSRITEWLQDLFPIDWISEPLDDSRRDRLDVISRVLRHESFPQNVVTAAADAVNTLEGVAMKFEHERDVVDLHVTRGEFDALRAIIHPRCMDVIRDLVGTGKAAIPGSDAVKGPGLSEICRNCCLNRPDEKARRDRRRDDNYVAAADDLDMQRLRVIPSRSDWPQWPLEDSSDANPRPPQPASPPVTRTEPKPDPKPYADWLGSRSDRPLISLLFGGGVFRGVFHMGVMNALSEAGLEPDLVAGSSVGSIVAAMIASAFRAQKDDRHRRIASLAATFLAIDRLVLTDRLADFVRRFTLRAAEAEFSPRDVDRALRQFDSDDPKKFNRRIRKVAAGLERLFYFSPFELLDVIRSARNRETSSMATALIHDIQEFLERGGLGQEILGSESLSLLIQRHVVRGGELRRFASFREGSGNDRKIFFLATATNLVQGGLEILGAPWNDPNNDVLTEFGLLASSAFPAVFRPRQAWEVFVKTDRGDDKYVDGGTIDNLPLDAVARFLSEASKSDVVNRRHAVGDIPHLLFTASLEVNEAIHDVSDHQLEREATEFLSLMRRAGRFKYNRKIDAYSAVQRRLRAIRQHCGPQQGWESLNMHVIAVKPNWLCGTFGFHPMLGFKRRKQAQSIAHGCAATLAALHGTREKRKEWFDGWTTRPMEDKKELDFDPKAVRVHGASIELRPQMRTDGKCWFRGDVLCPFSSQATTRLNGRLPEEQHVKRKEIEELHRIYVECGDPATHRPAR